MKQSKYNYIVPYKNSSIFYNGITDSFFIVPKEKASTYSAILENPDPHKESFGLFLERMKSQGFIVEDSEDEFLLVKRKIENRRNPHQYYLMILPTYQCNLKCWYCIQDHQNLFMDESTAKRIKLLIRNKLKENSIDSLHISWFGGEPLMAYNTVLNLTTYAQEECKKMDKIFTSAITTNGTLLNPSRIEELRKAGVTHYQITIDGDKPTHDSVKQLGSTSAYERTMDNIELIAQHTSVSMRFNYTHKNLMPERIIEGIKSKISKTSIKNIQFNLFKVWQENEAEISEEAVDKLFNLAKNYGLHTTLITSGLCYTDFNNYDCIFPNGTVGKCDNHQPEDMPGRLTEEGTIEWTEDVSYYSYNLSENSDIECHDCKLFPICYGPCVVKRENMIKNHGFVTCMYDNKDQNMHDLIINACKSRLQSTINN